MSFRCDFNTSKLPIASNAKYNLLVLSFSTFIMFAGTVADKPIDLIIQNWPNRFSLSCRSADHIYQLAQKLGPIRRENLKIDLSIFDPAGEWLFH